MKKNRRLNDKKMSGAVVNVGDNDRVRNGRTEFEAQPLHSNKLMAT